MSIRPWWSGVTLLALFAAGDVLAAGVHWGIRAGINASAFAGEFGDAVEPDPRVGPNVGLVGEYALSPALALRGEVAYSSKGGRKASEGTDPFGNPVQGPEAVWSFDYLEIPLLVRARIPTAARVTPFLELGPTLGIRLKGRIEPGWPGAPDLDVTEDMKTLDAGFGAGLGVEFPTGAGRLGLEARYLRGFSDLYDVDGNAPTVNQAWSFALSWLR